MTLYREPNTIEYAVHHTALALNEDGVDGHEELARHLGFKSGNLIRKWSNPNQTELPSFKQCLTMDAVMVNSGRGTPMIAAVYEARLELATRERPEHVPEDPHVLLHRVSKELGDVMPALLKALLDPNASPNTKRDAQREIHELKVILQKAERELSTDNVREFPA